MKSLNVFIWCFIIGLFAFIGGAFPIVLIAMAVAAIAAINFVLNIIFGTIGTLVKVKAIVDHGHANLNNQRRIN